MLSSLLKDRRIVKRGARTLSSTIHVSFDEPTINVKSNIYQIDHKHSDQKSPFNEVGIYSAKINTKYKGYSANAESEEAVQQKLGIKLNILPANDVKVLPVKPVIPSKPFNIEPLKLGDKWENNFDLYQSNQSLLEVYLSNPLKIFGVKREDILKYLIDMEKYFASFPESEPTEYEHIEPWYIREKNRIINGISDYCLSSMRDILREYIKPDITRDITKLKLQQDRLKTTLTPKLFEYM